MMSCNTTRRPNGYLEKPPPKWLSSTFGWSHHHMASGDASLCYGRWGGGCLVIPPPTPPPHPLIFHNKSPYDGLNKRRAPAAFVLSGADLNPTLIVSHYKEGNLWGGGRRGTEYTARTLNTPRNFQLTPRTKAQWWGRGSLERRMPEGNRLENWGEVIHGLSDPWALCRSPAPCLLPLFTHSSSSAELLWLITYIFLQLDFSWHWSFMNIW